jgi:hypothetical protein
MGFFDRFKRNNKKTVENSIENVIDDSLKFNSDSIFSQLGVGINKDTGEKTYKFGADNNKTIQIITDSDNNILGQTYNSAGKEYSINFYNDGSIKSEKTNLFNSNNGKTNYYSSYDMNTNSVSASGRTKADDDLIKEAQKAWDDLGTTVNVKDLRKQHSTKPSIIKQDVPEYDFNSIEDILGPRPEVVNKPTGNSNLSGSLRDLINQNKQQDINDVVSNNVSSPDTNVTTNTPNKNVDTNVNNNIDTDTLNKNIEDVNALVSNGHDMTIEEYRNNIQNGLDSSLQDELDLYKEYNESVAKARPYYENNGSIYDESIGAKKLKDAEDYAPIAESVRNQNIEDTNKLLNYGHDMSIDEYRNNVILGLSEDDKAELNLYNEYVNQLDSPYYENNGSIHNEDTGINKLEQAEETARRNKKIEEFNKQKQSYIERGKERQRQQEAIDEVNDKLRNVVKDEPAVYDTVDYTKNAHNTEGNSKTADNTSSNPNPDSTNTNTKNKTKTESEPEIEILDTDKSRKNKSNSNIDKNNAIDVEFEMMKEAPKNDTAPNKPNQKPNTNTTTQQSEGSTANPKTIKEQLAATFNEIKDTIKTSREQRNQGIRKNTYGKYEYTRVKTSEGSVGLVRNKRTGDILQRSYRGDKDGKFYGMFFDNNGLIEEEVYGDDSVWGYISRKYQKKNKLHDKRVKGEKAPDYMMDEVKRAWDEASASIKDTVSEEDWEGKFKNAFDFDADKERNKFQEYMSNNNVSGEEPLTEAQQAILDQREKDFINAKETADKEWADWSETNKGKKEKLKKEIEKRKDWAMRARERGATSTEELWNKELNEFQDELNQTISEEKRLKSNKKKANRDYNNRNTEGKINQELKDLGDISQLTERLDELENMDLSKLSAKEKFKINSSKERLKARINNTSDTEEALKHLKKEVTKSSRNIEEMAPKQLLKEVGMPTVFAGFNAVGTYKDNRREGKSVVSSAVRAAGDFVLSETLGPVAYMAVNMVKEVPDLAVKGSAALFKEMRRMNSSSRLTVFGESEFNDTQQLATMRQSGMELAKMSQYRLEQTLMGNEAKYLHK